MDKYKVEFMTSSGRSALEIYTSSEAHARDEIRKMYPHLNCIIQITNVSQEDRNRDRELKGKEEDKQREIAYQEKCRLEQEILSNMTPEEQKTYFENKSKKEKILIGLILILSCVGLLYGLKENILLLVFPCALCFAGVALYILYRLLIYILPLVGFVFLCFYLYSHSSLNKPKNESQNSLVNEQKEIQLSQNNEKYFISQVNKILTQRWQETIDTKSGNQAKVLIKIDSKGKFNYEIISISEDKKFNSKLKFFLESMKNVSFPKYEHGTLFQTQINFRDMLEK